MSKAIGSVVLLAWLGGCTLFVALLIHYGSAGIFAATAAAGWGLVVVAAFHLVPMILDTRAWVVLLPRAERPRFARLLYLRWIGESVNGLLPAAQVGGDLVRARLLLNDGVSKRTAAASVIVNLTLSVVSLMLFGLLGAAIFIVQRDALLDMAASPGALAGALGVAVAVAVGLVAVQRRGAFHGFARLLARAVPGRDLSHLLGGASRLDDTVAGLYRQRPRIWASTAWTFLGWVAGAGEIWLALYFLGHPIGWLDAILFESLIQAIRNGAFFIPGALGIQEGGMVVLSALFGLTPETALALALVKRVRELLLGAPGLLVWQFTSGLHWLRRRRRARGCGRPPILGG